MKHRILRHRFALWIIAALALASCSQDELAEQGTTLPEGEYQLTLTASVDGMKTRSAGKDAWQDGDEIGVRIGPDGKTGQYRLNGDGSVKEAVMPVYWQNTAPATVTAWYPYKPQTDVDISGQGEGFASFDFLTATAENQTFQSPVNLNFYHQMAKVSYTLVKGDGITDEELKGAVVTLLGDASATFEYGVLAPADQTDGEIISCYDGITRTGAALLVPQDMTGKPLIKVSVNGSTFTYTPATETVGNLLSGYHNTYTITVKANGIEVTGVTGGKWTEGGSEDVPVITYKTDLSTAKVGDLITASGKLIDVSNLANFTPYNSEQVVGVVFWTPAETDYDDPERQTPARLTDDKIMAAEHPGCTHGLAVAVKKVLNLSSDNVSWQDPYGSVKDFQDSDNFIHDKKDDFVSVLSGTGATDNINKIYGYQNTVVIRAYNQYCTDNNLAYKVKPVVAIDKFIPNNPAPEGSTGWFLPSAKELHILCYKDVDDIASQYDETFTFTRDIVNASLSAVGGDLLEAKSYWSSSEGENTYYPSLVFNVNLGSAWVQNGSKYSYFRTRVVCAF